MKTKKKYKRIKKTKFTKNYTYTMQDDDNISHLKYLQNVYSKIAEQVFNIKPHVKYGDWKIQLMGLTLYIDPIFGCQAEIMGSENFSLSKRYSMHIRFLNLISQGWTIKGALQYVL